MTAWENTLFAKKTAMSQNSLHVESDRILTQNTHQMVTNSVLASQTPLSKCLTHGHQRDRTRPKKHFKLEPSRRNHAYGWIVYVRSNHTTQTGSCMGRPPSRTAC